LAACRSYSSEDTALAELCTDRSEETSAVKADRPGLAIASVAETPVPSRRGRSRESSPEAEESASPKPRLEVPTLGNASPVPDDDSPRPERHRSDAPSLADSNFASEAEPAEKEGQDTDVQPGQTMQAEAEVLRPRRPHFDGHVEFVSGDELRTVEPGIGPDHSGEPLERRRAYTVGGEPSAIPSASPRERGKSSFEASALSSRRNQTVPASTRATVPAQTPVRHASLGTRARASGAGRWGDSPKAGTPRSGQVTQGQATKVLRVELQQRKGGPGTRQAVTSQDTSRSRLNSIASSGRASSTGSPTVVKGTIVSQGAKGYGAQHRARTAETRQLRQNSVQVRGKRPGAATTQFYDEAMDCLRLQAGQLAD